MDLQKEEIWERLSSDLYEIENTQKILLGFVWEEQKVWFAMDEERNYITRGFATREYAIEFLEQEALRKNAYPKMKPVDLGW